MFLADTSRVGRSLRSLWEQVENPVMGREFRSRMRGIRSYLITGGYTAVVLACVLAAYWNLAGQGSDIATLNRLAAVVGRGIWTWGCLAQAALLPLIVPAFTCGGITVEREREMLELLLLTRQSPLQICLGKLGSGVGLGLMLVLSSVPVLSLSLILGGVSPGEIGAAVLVLVSCVLVVGALGLAVSTLVSRTVTATVVTYLVVGFVMMGVPALAMLFTQAYGMSQSGDEWAIWAMLLAYLLVALAPAVGLAGIIYTVTRLRSDTEPERSWWLAVTGGCWAVLMSSLHLPGMSDLLLHGDMLLLMHPMAAVWALMAPRAYGAPPSNLWMVCVCCYLGATFWLFLVAVLRVRRLRSG